MRKWIDHFGRIEGVDFRGDKLVTDGGHGMRVVVNPPPDDSDKISPHVIYDSPEHAVTAIRAKLTAEAMRLEIVRDWLLEEAERLKKQIGLLQARVVNLEREVPG